MNRYSITSLVFLFFLNLTFSLAQNNNQVYGTVHYQSTNNLGKRVTSKMLLKFNTESSYYLEILDKSKNLNEDTPEEVKRILGVSSLNNLENYFVHYDLESSKMVYNKRAFKSYQFLEEKEKFKWEITNDIKKIGKYSCQKAISEFRGRKYEAWFSTEIKVPFGPWKANNLGGLILELNEADGLLQIIATEISISSVDNGIQEDIEKNKYNGKSTISIKDYGKIKRKEWEENLSVVRSRLPKGAFLREGAYNTTDHLEYFAELDEWH